MNEDTTPLIGRLAPNFMLPRSLYQAFSLHDVRGRPAVLAFYPGDWEPVSDEQLRQLQEHLSDLHRFDADLVAISVDSVWSHIRLARALGLTFPILSDFQPKGQVSRAYQVYREEEGRSGRALFIVDPGGVVRWSRVLPTNLNPGVQGILRTLHTLNGRTAPASSNEIETIHRSVRSQT
jgi:peroxiredoxin